MILKLYNVHELGWIECFERAFQASFSLFLSFQQLKHAQYKIWQRLDSNFGPVV